MTKPQCFGRHWCIWPQNYQLKQLPKLLVNFWDEAYTGAATEKLNGPSNQNLNHQQRNTEAMFNVSSRLFYVTQCDQRHKQWLI